MFSPIWPGPTVDAGCGDVPGAGTARGADPLHSRGRIAAKETTPRAIPSAWGDQRAPDPALHRGAALREIAITPRTWIQAGLIAALAWPACSGEVLETPESLPQASQADSDAGSVSADAGTP